MTLLAIVLIPVLCVMSLSYKKVLPHYSYPINSILGDVSFMNKFGHEPNASTDEDLRIRTHLEYVENWLRQKDVSGLSRDLQQRRSELLTLLHHYWTTNVFPRNYDHAGKRIPCFIDKDERICAVGYLIEKTAGRDVAEKINSKHKYERILDMNDADVQDWIAHSGLSREECASIQPEYGYGGPYYYDNVTTEYAISSSLLGAANLSLSTINAIQMTKGTKDIAVPIVGLATGAGQAILGIVMMPTESNGYKNKENQTLSMVNIGLGVTTMILSTWNLVTTPESNEKNIGWNFYSYPTKDGDIVLGLSLTQRF